MHSDKVLAPLNVTTHDFLILLKEATGTTILPSPTVEHSLLEVLHKINGTSSSDDRGQEDGSSMTMNAARAAAAATANITVNEQLIAVESAVAQATSHLEANARTCRPSSRRCRQSITRPNDRARK